MTSTDHCAALRDAGERLWGYLSEVADDLRYSGSGTDPEIDAALAAWRLACDQSADAGRVGTDEEESE